VGAVEAPGRVEGGAGWASAREAGRRERISATVMGCFMVMFLRGSVTLNG
jgi:hypothetical protein